MDSNDSKKEQLWPLEGEQLPVELQWENMEAGILQKMEELQAAAASDDRKRFIPWWIYGLAVLIGGASFLLFFQITASTQQEITKTADGQTGLSPEASPLEDPGGALDLPVAEDFQTAAPVQRNDEEDAEVLTPKVEESRPLLMPVTLGHLVPAIGLEAEYPVGSTPSAATVAPLTTSDNLGVEISESQEQAMDSLQQRLSITESAGPGPARPSFSPSAQVWLLGGASVWQPGYGNTNPERAAFEQSILSFHGQLSYVLPLKKGMVLVAGLQYQQLQSRLNWTTTLEDFEVTLEDTVVQIQRNVFSGEEVEVRGNVSLVVPAERRVQHYNKFGFLQIPLSVGKMWGGNKWQTHVLVGGIVTIPITRTGRTLNEGALIDFDRSTSGIWTDKARFGATLGAGIQYRLTEKLGVMTTFQLQQSLTNWSVETNVNLRPTVLNWSMGMQYSW